MSDISRKSSSKRTKAVNTDTGASPTGGSNAPVANLRNWCWTLNNYYDEELFEIDTLCDNADNNVRGVCYGKEIGENNTPHLQGYIELKVARMKTAEGGSRGTGSGSDHSITPDFRSRSQERELHPPGGAGGDYAPN